MWLPLLNHYRSYGYRQISTVGTIDCPNPKWFNSPLTQNQFLILERILSDNWCLGSTFSNWPQVSLMFKFFFWTPINWTKIFNCRQKRPGRPAKKQVAYWGYTLAEVGPRAWKRCNNYLTKTFFFKFPYLVHRPTAAPVAAENFR